MHGVSPGRFTDWREIGEDSDLLFYEGLHGAVKTDINIADFPISRSASSR